MSEVESPGEAARETRIGAVVLVVLLVVGLKLLRIGARVESEPLPGVTFTDASNVALSFVTLVVWAISLVRGRGADGLVTTSRAALGVGCVVFGAVGLACFVGAAWTLTSPASVEAMADFGRAHRWSWGVFALAIALVCAHLARLMATRLHRLLNAPTSSKVGKS